MADIFPPAANPSLTTAAAHAIILVLMLDGGWDSSNKTWYFGHTLYMLCSRNNTLKTELPLLVKFTSARHHDSKNFLYAIDDFGRNAFGISP